MLTRIKNYLFPPKKNAVTQARPLKEESPITPNSNAGLWTASKKIAAGTIIIGIDYFYDKFSSNTPSSQETALSATKKAIGYGLIMDGISDMGMIGLRSLAHGCEKLIHKKNKPQKLKISSEIMNRRALANPLIPNKTILKFDAVLRFVNIYGSALNTLFSLLHLIRALNNLYHAPVNILSLSFPEGRKLSNSLWPHSLTFPALNYLIALLPVMGFFYNLRETKLSYLSPYPRQGDVPIFGLNTANTYLEVSAEIAYRFSPKPEQSFEIFTTDMTADEHSLRLVELIQNMQPLPQPGFFYHFSGIFNKVSAFYFYKNLLQVILNASDYYKDTSVTIEEVIDSPTPLYTKPEPTKDTGTRAQKTIIAGSNHKPREPNANTTAALAPQFSSSISSGKEKHEPVVIKEKRKTKGLARPDSKVETAFTPSFQSLTERKKTRELYPLDDNLRIQALGFINNARRLRVVSEHKIMSHLEKLKNLLPNARIYNITGSEHALIWTWNDTDYSIKYESTHGNDHGQFARSKLKKILNVLEAGYLWGWGKEKIQGYLANRVSSGRLEPLYYIFGERPSF